MPVLTVAQVIALGRKHDFTEAELPDLHAVTWTEARNKTDARQRNGLGRGLVQIDLGQHRKVTEAQAYDPDYAMAFARRLSRNKAGLGPPNWYGPRDQPAEAEWARAEVRKLLKGTPMATVRGGITVKPHVQAFANACQVATGADSYGTYHGHSPPEGPTQALDIFNPTNANGYRLQDKVADFAIKNQKRFGVRYVIKWNPAGKDFIWNIERADEGWRAMATRDHSDHVHITFYAKAAELEPDPEPEPQEDDMAFPLFGDSPEGREYAFWMYDGVFKKKLHTSRVWDEYQEVAKRSGRPAPIHVGKIPTATFDALTDIDTLTG